MKAMIGKDLKVEFARRFVAADADLGDAAVVGEWFERLVSREIGGRGELEAWLLDVSELLAAVMEEEAVRYIRMTCQTADPERESAYLAFVETVKPLTEREKDRLAKKLLAHPAAAELDRERYFVLLRDLKNEVEIFREENVPLLTEEQKLSQRYQKMIGVMTVEHDGAERTLAQMAKYLELPEREVRREAWEKVTARRLRDREELDRLFDEMLGLRGRIAANAGFGDYRDYCFRKRQRFDYGVAECESFHAAVESRVVPLYREQQERRRKQMGLGRLRPWDLSCDPLGRPPLKPFATTAELTAGCLRIFEKLDPAVAERFRFMLAHDLADLESRKGKAPGAYSHFLEEKRVPFIFQSAVGVDYDVKTLLHEFGHSLHSFECRDEPLVYYRTYPLEFAEVASMSMEFLGLDHLSEFYGEAEVARSRAKRLEEVIWLFCWVAAIDSFQHWIYTHPGHSVDERADAWERTLDRFGGIEDWSGFAEARRFLWHRQLHIFEIPFYYIEYAIAELGALQVWARSKKDVKTALRDYRRGLSLGGSRPLPKLFEAAGIRFDFSAATIAPLVGMVREELEKEKG